MLKSFFELLDSLLKEKLAYNHSSQINCLLLKKL